METSNTNENKGGGEDIAALYKRVSPGVVFVQSGQGTGSGFVYDSKGDKIGTLGQVYTGGETGQPEWASVNTGLYGVDRMEVSPSVPGPERLRRCRADLR